MKNYLLLFTFFLLNIAMYSQQKRDFTTHQTSDRRDYFSRNTSVGSTSSEEVETINERVTIIFINSQSVIKLIFLDRKDMESITLRYSEIKVDGQLTGYKINYNEWNIASAFFSDDGFGNMEFSILFGKPGDKVFVFGPLSNGYY